MRGVVDTLGRPRSSSSLGRFVPQDHPLRRIRRMTDLRLDTLREWLHLTFFPEDTHSIAPEKLVRALLLQVMYSILGDRQLVDRIWSSELFRSFVGIGPEDSPPWNPDIYAKLRQQLLDHEIVRRMISGILETVDVGQLVSADAALDRPDRPADMIPASSSGKWRVLQISSRGRPQLHGGEVVEGRASPSCRSAPLPLRS
jgi:transposase